VEGPAAHGRDVAEVDIESLATQEPRRMIGQPEILVLDQDVGRQKEPLRSPDEGGIVADAEQDVGPLLNERAPDP
jgi:hypothetical protein